VRCAFLVPRRDVPRITAKHFFRPIRSQLHLLRIQQGIESLLISERLSTGFRSRYEMHHDFSTVVEKVARRKGVEPLLSELEARCSFQLN
jgi:hypothetical protein